MSYQTIEQYAETKELNRATVYRRIKNGKLGKVSGKNLVYEKENIPAFNKDEKQILQDNKHKEWNSLLEKAREHYIKNDGRNSETTKLLQLIVSDAAAWKAKGIKVKGYNQLRPLQIKIQKGNITRKARTEHKPIRHHLMSDNKVYNKAAYLFLKHYLQDKLASVQLAVDNAIHHAKRDEDFYEVASLNIYSYRNWMRKLIKQYGLKTLHLVENHYNLFRIKLPYVTGSFTTDLKFNEVWSVDDHKSDVAGAKVWNEKTGEFEQKHVYSWAIVECTTMMILAYEIKTTPFTSEDIVKLFMKAMKMWGRPSWKVICDNGLGDSDRLREFLGRLHIEYECQWAYEPTNKSTNERAFGLIKNEHDAIKDNFTGSNHQKEGYHPWKKLSPEETTYLLEEYIASLDKYINGKYLDRPRAMKREGCEHLLDNTHRVSIRSLFYYQWERIERAEITDVQLRMAYLKYDKLIKLDGFTGRFKKQDYLPTQTISTILVNNSYTFTVAYNPNDYSCIDLYAREYILDASTGAYWNRNDLVCTMKVLAGTADEKKKAVAIYKKSIQKNLREIGRLVRERYQVDKQLPNVAVTGDGEMVNIRKEQEAQLAELYANAVHAQNIDDVFDELKQDTTFDADEAVSVESIESVKDKINSIKV